MKTRSYSYVMVSLLLIGISTFSFGQSDNSKLNKKKTKHEKRLEQFNETKKLIESHDFIFTATRVFPTGASSVDLISNPGTIIFKGDVVAGGLPYFGRSYTAQYGSNKSGMEFSGKIKDEEIKINEKKLKIYYSFKVSDQELFGISMDIAFNGKCSVTINSQNKSSIAYSGSIEKDEEKEESKQ